MIETPYGTIPPTNEFTVLPTKRLTKEEFDALFFEYTGPVEVREFTPYEERIERLSEDNSELAWLARINPPSKVVSVLTFLKNFPILIERATKAGTKMLSESINEALKANRISPNYYANSIERLDATKNTGIVSVKLLKEAMILMGIQVIVNRLSKLEQEKIAEMEGSILAHGLKFAGRAAISTPEMKAAFTNILFSVQAALNSVAQAEIEKGVREECFSVMLKLLDLKFKQNRKFGDGETRIYKVVASRIPNVQEPANLP